MDSAHITPHKWSLYLIYCILLIFHNKKFTQVHILLVHTLLYQWLQFAICYTLFTLYNKKTQLPALPQGPTSSPYLHNSQHHNPLWPNTLAPTNQTSHLLCSTCFVLLLLYNNKYALSPFYQQCFYTICIISYYLHNQYNAITPTQYSTTPKPTHTSFLQLNQKHPITKAPSYPILSLYFQLHNHLRRSTKIKIILLLWLSYLPANKQSNPIVCTTNLHPQSNHTTNTMLPIYPICTTLNNTLHSHNLTQQVNTLHPNTNTHIFSPTQTTFHKFRINTPHKQQSCPYNTSQTYFNKILHIHTYIPHIKSMTYISTPPT